MPFYLALKNIFSRKSSFAIILFISFAISLLMVSNAFFDGTGEGIEKTFVNSFTGDIVIRPIVDFPLSLLGDETPATGSFSEIPQIVPYKKIFEKVNNVPGVITVLPQLTSPLIINTNGNNKLCIAFGVDSKNYLKAMPGVHIQEGRLYDENENGILLSEKMLENINENSGISYKVGDSIQLMAGNGVSYSLRSVILTGIYSYEIENEVLNKICLVNPVVLRELTGISFTSENNDEINESQNDLINTVIDIDDLFSSDFDIETNVMMEESTDFYSETEIKELFSSEISDHIDSTSWNFLVCKTSDNPKKVAKRLNRDFHKNEWDVEAVTWRSAAGLSAMYLYWIHNIFSLGVIVLLGVGLIIVNNTLTVNALDRIPETGMLRAIGSRKKFIFLQFFFETMILTVLSGILGIFIGCIFNIFINSLNIGLTNTYLIQVFGGNTLKTTITLINIVKCLFLSVVLGIIGWIYPVFVSMDVSPVQAMQRGL